ncbi:unnamed protein product [Lactuca virosa]|uniref:Uncharacterized protein n=1 Tax=Lactuca virosa TaxID=75947 RepID=A0AAU9LVE8_9ASTR|nr:unnamed protein product [Lactuca virosa]
MMADSPIVVRISTCCFLIYGSSSKYEPLGFGGVSVDLLAIVASFPNPDDKIRSTSMKLVNRSIKSSFVTSITGSTIWGFGNCDISDAFYLLRDLLDISQTLTEAASAIVDGSCSGIRIDNLPIMLYSCAFAIKRA